MQQQTTRRERAPRNQPVELKKGPEPDNSENREKRLVRQKAHRPWEKRKHDLLHMSIEDLREYLLDTEY